MTTRALPAVVCLAALLALPACTRHLNERPTLGNAVHTGTLDPATWAHAEGTVPDRTSDLGTDRAAWPAHVFLVPVDGTVHGPVRHRRVRLADGTRRQQGLYPTVESALDLQGDDRGALMLEGVLAPFAATFELAMLPVSAIAQPPFTDRQSPGELHKRSGEQAWSSAPGADR